MYRTGWATQSPMPHKQMDRTSSQNVNVDRRRLLVAVVGTIVRNCLSPGSGTVPQRMLVAAAAGSTAAAAAAVVVARTTAPAAVQQGRHLHLQKMSH